MKTSVIQRVTESVIFSVIFTLPQVGEVFCCVFGFFSPSFFAIFWGGQEEQAPVQTIVAFTQCCALGGAEAAARGSCDGKSSVNRWDKTESSASARGSGR